MWARQFVGQWNTERLDWLRIDTGRGGYHGLYGRCWYPADGKGYRISCQVPGPWPFNVVIRKPPLYKVNGVWPPVPAGLTVGAHCVDHRSGREWIQLRSITKVNNLSEGIVWIVAHEGFHWLRHSRQIPGYNSENQADKYADERLAEYRAA